MANANHGTVLVVREEAAVVVMQELTSVVEKRDNIPPSEAVSRHFDVPNYAKLLMDQPPLSVTQRYFTKHFFVGKLPDEDQCVLRHSNGLCVVCLSPRHQLVTRFGMDIETVDFHSGSTDRIANTLSGKRKKGGQQLQPQSILSVITCADGKRFNVKSCVKGTLLEVNERLISNKHLLVSKTLSDGYIALVMPRLQDIDKIDAELLSETQYTNRYCL